MEMKRKLSILSEEYCAAKKLPILDMPDLTNISTKTELNLNCLKEQNKNLAVSLEQQKLKQSEQTKRINDYETSNSKLAAIIVELKNTLTTLLWNVNVLKKEDGSLNNQDGVVVVQGSYIKQIDTIFSNIDNNSLDETQNQITQLKDNLVESLKQLMSQHTNGGSYDDNYKGTLGDEHSSSLNGSINMDTYHQKVSTLECQLESLTKKYKQSTNELNETLEYMDILRHKIYMMHDRYEEKVASIEHATIELNKEKAELDSQVQLIVTNNNNNSNNNSNQQDTSITMGVDIGVVAEFEKQLDDKSTQLDLSQTKYDQLELLYNKLNLDYQNLHTTHQLLSDIPITMKPEYKILLQKNTHLLDDNNKLREYLEFFWNILSEIKTVIKDNSNRFHETISNHVGLMIENITQLEQERDQLRHQGLQDSMAKQRGQDEIKQLNENIVEITNINTTLKNQNNFYSTQLKKQHEELKSNDDDNDTTNNNVTTIEEARNLLKQHSSIIRQLRAEQETFIAEMEITVQSYDETYDQNTSLMDKLKEKQNSNLRLSSDLFKCNQSIQLLNSRLVNCTKTSNYNSDVLEKYSKNLNERLIQVDSLRVSLENQLNNAIFKHADDDADGDGGEHHHSSIDQLNEQLQLKQHELQVNDIQLKKTIANISICQIDLEKSNQIINNLTSNVESLQMQLDDRNKLLDSLNNSNSTTTTTAAANVVSTDDILNEQIRMYKSKLTCACCNSNPINAIIYKCFHLFCHDCLQVRYDTRQRKCPNCNMTFGLNDFHRVFF